MKKKVKAPTGRRPAADADFEAFDRPHLATPTLNPQSKTGHTIIDVLVVRAGVLCVLGLDYSPTIALARRFAKFAERRARA
jgi:hypothetical protein